MNLFKVFCLFIFCIDLAACSQNKNTDKNDDTIVSGTIRLSVDESLKPIMQVELDVFEYLHPQAKLIVSYKSEMEVWRDFNSDSIRAIIVSRELTKEEINYFTGLKVITRSMPFARDGISFIINKNNILDSFTENEIKMLLNGKSERKINLVFDHPGSGILRWLKDSLLKDESLSKTCFTLQNTPEVIEYISSHENAIGIIGNSWISDRDDSNVVNTLKLVKRARISANGSDEFLEPYQSEIATSRYPFSRMLYCIQKDGKLGLGTGLQRFLNDEKGQLIVLKFGLMPFKLPERSVHFQD